jgi:acetyltransferase
VLSVAQADALLKLFDIKVPAAAAVESIAQAKKFLKKHTGPVVLKISSPDMIHKTDGGGVVVNIMSNQDLTSAWAAIAATAKRLPKKFSYSIHIQKQIEDGLEMIAGVKYDGSFGNVLVCGAGGILANLISDLNLRILPLNKTEALELIESSKAHTLLKGYRGHKPYALEKLADMLVRLANLTQASQYFSEITINPIIVTATDAWAVDPRIILK